MSNINSMRELPKTAGYKQGDILVVFGELFARGYANGLVEAAERAGMTIIKATVGRRDKTTGQLRPLLDSEITDPHSTINVPLEAGFDFEADAKGITPCDQLKEIKLSEWQQAKLNWSSIEESRQKATIRFRENTKEFLSQLAPKIKPGSNVLFAHLMAGGVPRAKIIMPLMNRVFKGTGDRHIPSKDFWESDLGKLCAMNFEDVTAQTLKHLLELSTDLRQKIERDGGQCSFIAYGYHGTEILINQKPTWQTYTPYLQGWAKMQLEKVAQEFWTKKVSVSVFNCPEILTNSSSIFIGVELSLYPLVTALQSYNKSPYIEKVLNDCKELLKDDLNFSDIQTYIQSYLSSDEIKSLNKFEQWPMHSNKNQMEKMILSSEHLVKMHKDEKNLITGVLSEAVFVACGEIMFHDSFKQSAPVWWLGHDIVAATLNQLSLK